MRKQKVCRQALGERIRPVLTVNKMDKCFLDLTVNGEETYQSIARVIKYTNAIITTCKDSFLADLQVDPVKGTVAFSSGLHDWAFTLQQFANFYATRYKSDESKIMRKLWGDIFFDTETCKWYTEHTGFDTCERGFVYLCYKPIQDITNACMNDEKDKSWTMLDWLGVTINNDEKQLTGEALVKCVMQNWLPASRALLEMIVYHLPSPLKAQNYRVDILYNGPLDDKYAMAIRNCDPEGPLIFYVSKMIPASNKGKFLAFGCVFSGRVAASMKVRIMGLNYVSGQDGDLYVDSAQQTVTWIGRNQEFVEDIPCGNLIAVLVLDKFITNSATLTNENEVDAYPIQSMKFSVAPLVCVNVRGKCPSDLPMFLEGLKCLEKSYPTMTFSILESGECIIAGAGEFHLQICLKDLRVFMDPAEVTTSHFGALFCETVVDQSSHAVTRYFMNKFNEISMKALPLEKDVLQAIDDGRIDPYADLEDRSRVLFEDFGWEKDVAKKSWSFGPDTSGPNMVVDMRKDGSDEIKDSVVAGFQLA